MKNKTIERPTIEPDPALATHNRLQTLKINSLETELKRVKTDLEIQRSVIASLDDTVLALIALVKNK